MVHTNNNTMARDADDVLDLEALAQAEHLKFLLKLSPIIFLANLSAGATFDGPACGRSYQQAP